MLQLRSFFLWAPFILGRCVISQDDDITAKVRIDAPAFGSLVDVVKDEILPDLIIRANNEGPYALGSSREGFTVNIPLVGRLFTGVEASSTLLQIKLSSFGDIAVDPIPSTRNKAMRLRITVRNVNVGVTVATSLRGFVAGIRVLTCSPNFSPSASIGLLTSTAELQLSSDGRTSRLQLLDVDFNNVNANINSSGGSNLCGSIASEIVGFLGDVILDIAGFLVNELSSVLEGAIQDLANDVLRDEFIPIAITESLDLLKGRVNVDFAVRELDSASQAVKLSVFTGFSSVLNEPSYRQGLSINPSLDLERAVPDPTGGGLVNAHLGLDFINQLLANVWYLAWPLLQEEPSAMESILCEPLPNDPCPFPPYQDAAPRASSGIFGFSSGSLAMGLFRDFSFEAFVPIPTVFADGNLLAMSARGKILLRGTPLFGGETVDLVSFEAQIKGSVATPLYNTTTNTIQNLAIGDIEIEDVEAEFIQGRPLLGLGVNSVLDTARTIINFLFDAFLPLVNQEIKSALDNFPIDIPPVVDFPRPGKSLQLSLSAASLEVSPNEGDTQAFLDVVAGLSARVIGSAPLRVTQDDPASLIREGLQETVNWVTALNDTSSAIPYLSIISDSDLKQPLVTNVVPKRQRDGSIECFVEDPLTKSLLPWKSF